MPTAPHIERHFTAIETVRDVVIGMPDGLTVPFALELLQKEGIRVAVPRQQIETM